MPRQRHQDAWIATIKVSNPIDASSPDTLMKARAAVMGVWAAQMSDGTAVEIIAQRFGRMAIQASAAPAVDTAAPQRGEGTAVASTVDYSEGPMGASDLADPDLPLAFDRRVPRTA